ncbi:MAG: hypothetical protein MUD01_08340 [Chloroflexaceae bacterium]|jgi:hypothetical protein|nr:hypothetical protein [Chloroflexaceae bacterium]
MNDRDGLFELAASFTGSASRMALMLLSAPLILLPKGSRRRVRRAMAEIARATVALPRELTNVSLRVVDDIFEGGNMGMVGVSGSGSGSRATDTFAERARNFSDRLSRAADEFGAGVRSMGSRAADEVEKAAGRVDEWTEKK